VTLTEFHKLERRTRWKPGAEAFLLWPFGWGLFSVALMWLFSNAVFWRDGSDVHASLAGIGIGLVAGGIASVAMCWWIYRYRLAIKAEAVARLKAVAAEVSGT